MGERVDVAVVGAGPAGSSAALFAALGGARTLLLDQRPEIGHPVQCGEFLPTLEELEDLFPHHAGFADVFQVPDSVILQRTHALDCVAPSGRHYPFPVEGFSVSRRAFDKVLAHRAEAAGAELRYPCGVTAVEGDTLRLATGETIKARVVIGADGPLSTVARAHGMTPARQMYRMITATVDGDFPPTLELFFGSLAPGGYAWVIPKGGEANVGLGVTHIPRGQSLSRLLQSFAARRGLGTTRDPTRWWVPLGYPPRSLVHGSALLAGDAANMVMATNGGGIPTAMISGMDAGRAAADHVRTGAPLARYDDLWKAHLETPLRRGYDLKVLGDRVAGHDRLLSLGMRYLGVGGLDALMRLKRPRRLGGFAS